MSELGFLDYFNEIKDPRVKRNQLYSMAEILLTTFCAVICGAEGWCDIASFGTAKLEFLRNYLPYPNGIPQDDTFRRFFRAIDKTAFKSCFMALMQDILPKQKLGTIAIDGKQSRRSFDHGCSALHMVSAFASEARLVLGQQACAEKSNEITAIPELLRMLDIKNHTVSIDAMGCQHKIANQIREQGGDYVLGLKDNQKHLHNAVKSCFESENNLKTAPSVQEETKAHGRIEKRHCTVIDVSDIEWFQRRYQNWKDLSSIIQIKNERTENGKTSKEVRYYISSMIADASKALYAVRSHWAIENSLHWVLDMSFNDDQSRIRKQNAPENMAVVKHFVMNMLKEAQKMLIQKQKTGRKPSIKGLRKQAAWDEQTLHFILTQHQCRKIVT